MFWIWTLYFTSAEDEHKEKECPPEFRVQMRDINTRVGEPATFDCQIMGYPRPEVYWTKDDQRLPESPRWKFIIEDDHFTLLIYEVSFFLFADRSIWLPFLQIGTRNRVWNFL